MRKYQGLTRDVFTVSLFYRVSSQREHDPRTPSDSQFAVFIGPKRGFVVMPREGETCRSVPGEYVGEIHVSPDMSECVWGKCWRDTCFESGVPVRRTLRSREAALSGKAVRRVDDSRCGVIKPLTDQDFTLTEKLIKYKNVDSMILCNKLNLNEQFFFHVSKMYGSVPSRAMRNSTMRCFRHARSSLLVTIQLNQTISYIRICILHTYVFCAVPSIRAIVILQSTSGCFVMSKPF